MENGNNIIISVKNKVLFESAKVGATLKGGKADGYTIKKIITEKKWYGTITYLHLESTKKNLKRIVMYDADRNRISEFITAPLTTTQGSYYISWS